MVTADHGLLDTHESQKHWIEPSDALASCLSREPSGDTRVVYFSLRKGKETRFRDEFARRFEGRFILLCKGRGAGTGAIRTGHAVVLRPASVLETLSRSPWGPTSFDSTTLASGEEASQFRTLAHHSGLTHAEMRIPLIVI